VTIVTSTPTFVHTVGTTLENVCDHTCNETRHVVDADARHGALRPAGPLATRMLAAIAWYQEQRSGALSPCRFFPSCSEYAHDAITLHGPVRGGFLTLRRLLRCRPFGPSGYDPVPTRVTEEETGNV